MCGPSANEVLSRIATGQNKLNKGGGGASSGGIGFGLPATTKTGPARMQRTASAANFMALFGPQTQG